MQNIKTAIVVTVLLMTVYGVYRVLNQPQAAPTQAMVELDQRFQDTTLDVEVGGEEPDGDAASLAPPPVDLDGEVDSVADTRAPQSAADEASLDSIPPLPDGGLDKVEDPEEELSAHSQPAERTHLADRRGTSRSSEPEIPSPTSEEESLAPEENRPGSSTDPHDHNVAESTVPGTEETPSTQQRSASTGTEAVHSEPTGPAFEDAWRESQTDVQEGAYAAALKRLSVFYNSPDLSDDQHARLLELLDPLAGKVVYSTEHLLVQPHRIGSRERLEDIAKRYGVPWQLLQNINGIENPDVLVPGQELKVVQGPFHADVDLRRGELTVFAQNLYAGRFPVSIGNDPSPVPGEYQVREKRTDRDYVTLSGASIGAADPENPYGGVWLDLGHRLCIHGSPRVADRGAVAPGCIGLAPRDAEDVFAILSEGSSVTIRR